ncbi:MAG: Gfo/Idh/MocA family oxidoreductase, partial [Planctomycetota bacterium]
LVEQQLKLPTTKDYTSLLGNVDAAVVAAPTVAHYEITSELLRAGVHCLVEKPLALTADQSQRLVQIATSHGRTLQVGHVERFNPMWTAAQAEMGTPKFIEAVRMGPYSGRSTDIGVVFDLMVHDLDLILSLDRSRVTSVQATGIALFGAHEDIAEARIHFDSGMVATIKASRVAQTPERRMKVFSTAGFADIDFSGEELHTVSPNVDLLSHSVMLDALPAAERMAAKEKIYSEWLTPKAVTVSKRNAILDEQNDFALSIHSGSQPAVSGEDGSRAVEVASQIVSAIEQHQWDGASSKPWRIGARASEVPAILPMGSSAETETVHEENSPQRRAG